MNLIYLYCPGEDWAIQDIHFWGKNRDWGCVGSPCILTKAAESQCVTWVWLAGCSFVQTLGVACMLEGWLWAAQVGATSARHCKAPKIAGQRWHSQLFSLDCTLVHHHGAVSRVYAQLVILEGVYPLSTDTAVWSESRVWCLETVKESLQFVVFWLLISGEGSRSSKA